MKIHIDGKEDQEFDFEGSAEELLKKLNINLETVVITKNNELITEDESLKNSDQIKIISVVSGG